MNGAAQTAPDPEPDLARVASASRTAATVPNIEGGRPSAVAGERFVPYHGEVTSITPTGTAGGATIRRNWRRAARCSTALVLPSRENGELMEFALALAGPALQRHFESFCAHPDGARLLAERPSLRSHLTDPPALAALPAGSFGRAYLDFTNGLGDINEVVDRIDALGARLGWNDAVTYYVARSMQTHDMWHVLCDYGTDWAGEAAVVAFTCGQIPFAGSRMLYYASSMPGGRDVPRRVWHRFLAEARRRGERSSNLMVAPYEELLQRPIDEVRHHLRIPPVEVAHPAGMPRSRAWPGFARTTEPLES